MAQKKKLQVFVSSTYDDLRDERQAAVEAILRAGHIPAGMELFAAGDQSQLETIQRWINESDVFLLILGGRYGSLEPKSKKSYLELEFEYAHQKGKPSFAVVITDDHLEEKVKSHGTKVLERESQQQLKTFREIVLSRTVRFWSHPNDIRLAVYETLSDFARRDELVGWIPGDQAVNTGALAEEIARLGKENASLREQLSKVLTPSVLFNGLTYEQVFDYLAEKKIDSTLMTNAETVKTLKKIAKTFGSSEPALLHLFWLFRSAFRKRDKITVASSPAFLDYLHNLAEFGLIRLSGGRQASLILT